MPVDSKSIVLKQPLWKKTGILLASVAFVIVGVLLITAEEYLIGILCLVFFGAAGVVGLLKSRVVLIADAEGIIPTFVLPRGSSKKIPWAMVDRISIVTQTIRGSKHRHLALYLRDQNFLTSESSVTQTLSQAGVEIFQKTGMLGLDDGGTAQAYIPATMLPGWSVEKIVDQLNTMRPAASITQGTSQH